MKKILFATASIVAFSAAGAAMAEVKVTGDARLGLVYEDIDIGGDSEDDVDGYSRVRVLFTLTGVSDSGLTFGANIRADNAAGGADEGNEDVTSSEFPPVDPGPGATAEEIAAFEEAQAEFEADRSGRVSTAGDVFVSGSFGTLTYGDTDSALAQRTSNVDAINLTGLRDLHEINRGAQAGPRIRYDYDFDAFGVSLSTTGELEEFAVGASYSGDFGGTTINFGIGYDDFEENETVTASLGAGFGAFGVKVAFSQIDNDGDDISDGAVSLSYNAGDLDVAAFARFVDSDDNGDGEAYGIGASYDLGGGLIAKAGVSYSDDIGGIDDVTVADLGLQMEF